MKYARAIAFAALAGITIVSTGCSVARNQQTVGSYVDDAAVTTAVKAKMAEDKTPRTCATCATALWFAPELPQPLFAGRLTR